jgi:predicted O-linked N-acetylglucosamine transferase (SPINDLY family)
MIIGLFDTNWTYNLNTPYEEPLGGTQSAICYFLEEMASKGHKVFLINKIKHVLNIRGVIHVPVDNYINYIKIHNIQFDIVIVSCLPNDLFNIKNQLFSYNNYIGTLFCLWTGHDVDQAPSKLLNKKYFKDNVDLYMFVSEWQRTRYINSYQIPFNKTIIMRNGIGKPFEQYLDKPINKNKYSMAYCSVPWRGLELLEPIYKTLKPVQPKISLKIFSGMNIYQQDKDEYQPLYDKFNNLPDVKIEKGVSQTELARQLFDTEYLTYTNIFQETSCITVLQAMACGCIIVTSDLGALKETTNNTNYLVDVNPNNLNIVDYMNNYVNLLNNIINNNAHKVRNDNEQLKEKEMNNEKLREMNRTYIKNNYTWSTICNKFQKDIENILNEYRQFNSNEYMNTIKSSIELISNQKWLDCLKELDKINKYPILDHYYGNQLNTGLCLYNLKNYDLAKEFLKNSCYIKDNFDANKILAMIFLERDDLYKFVKYGGRAINHIFDITIACLVAEKSEILGNYHLSMSIYERILNIDPTNIIALNNLGNQLLLLCGTINLEETMKRTYENSLLECIKNKEHRKKELVLSNILFTNLYNHKLSAKDTYNKTIVWHSYFPKEENLVTLMNKLSRKKINTDKKIRIGYISTDFTTHPVGFMFESILKNHNLNNFEIFCYDNSNKSMNDPTTIRLKNYNNAKWTSIVDLNDEQALTTIINDNLDILVDMMGHTRNTRINLLQYKPARILVSYFAYPETTGIKEVDYKISDKYATPPNTYKFYTEKIKLMPNGFQCYTPPTDLPGTKNYTRDKYKINLCCYNNPSKLSPVVLDTFAEILKRLPEAKLYLRYCYYKSSFYKEHMYKLFENKGIARERIVVDFLPLSEALLTYNNMDIALDPFPYNGGTVSSEALYMNTPMITLEGENYVSRVGVSLLSNLGLTKYIAKNIEDYINKVVNLARSESELKELHNTLRTRMMNSDLVNSVSFTLNFEKVLNEMVDAFNNKLTKQK